ncbi:MAG: hypothetical protein KF799_15465 [Bdellovibrionales bacterium]|nr:hypothetical protein [Bdellovibrionales bacterium]
MKRLLVVSAFALFATGAVAGVVDLSQLQTQFEQKVIDRLRLGLDPILGKDQYSIAVRADYRAPNEQLRPVDTYFPKLGIAAPTPTSESTHVIQFERWVQTLEVDVSRSEDVQGVDDEALRTRVGLILKSFGSFKLKVNVTSFKPAAHVVTTRNWRDHIPWTPLAIVLGALSIASILFLAARSLASATTTAAATTAAATNGANSARNEDFIPDFKPEEKKPADAELPEGELKREGLGKWHEWLKEDAASAREFIERLARSEAPEERVLQSYLFQHSDLALLRPLLKKVSKDCLAAIKQSLSQALGMPELAAADRMLSQYITQYYVDESLDSDNLIKTVHDLSIEECVVAAEAEPAVLAVFMRCLSTPHVERIVAQLSQEQFQSFLDKVDQLSPPEMTKLATRARTVALERRKVSEERQALPLSKWMVVASHLDGEKERAFYTSAAGKLPPADLVRFAAENFPHFLAARLPDHILKAVLNSYTFEERAELIFVCAEEDRRRYLSFYEKEARVNDLLTVELEQIASEPQRERRLGQRKAEMNRDFLNRLRKFVRSTPEIQSAAEDLLRGWVEEQKGSSVDAEAA